MVDQTEAGRVNKVLTLHDEVSMEAGLEPMSLYPTTSPQNYS
jgi:hypothetical protein